MYKIIKTFLLLIFVTLTCSINNDAFANTACSPACEKGEYCLSAGMGNSKICTSCTNNLPNNADWDGPGEDNLEGSCPWKCNTGYYEYGDLCYQCPYGSTSTSDGKGCYWENVTFSDKNGPVTTDSSTLQLSESLLEKARTQQ